MKRLLAIIAFLILPVEAQGIWHKLGPIIPPNVTDFNGGTFFSGTSNGTVMYEGSCQIVSPNPDGKCFKMWFQGSNDLFYGEANDATHWTRRATAVVSNLGEPKVFKDGSTYYLYGNTPATNGTVISSYTSSDGITWSLQVATALNVGGVGQWDHTLVSYLTPFQKVGSTWSATYSTQLDSSHFAQFGIATSTDLLHWTNGANAVSTNTGSPDPHVIAGHYWVWTGGIFTGASHTSPFDGSRTDSADLITWTSPLETFPRTLFMEGVGLSTGAVGPQVLVEANGSTYNFYTGTPTETAGKGYVMMAAVAPNMTLADVAASSEGVASPSSPPPPPTILCTILFTDNMTRANETPLSDGGAWSIAPSTNVQANLVSNNAVATNINFSSRMILTGRTWGNNQCSQAKIGAGFTVTSFAGVNTNMQTGANTEYEFLVTPTAFILRKIIAGTATNLQTGVGTFAANDVLLLAHSGTTLTAYQNGTQITTASDNAISNGSPGFTLFDSVTPANAKFSTWSGGSLGARNVQAPYTLP